VRPILHPAALQELLYSGRYYAKISRRVSQNFREEVEVALEDIARNPERYREVKKGFRVRTLKKYPFSIVYNFESGMVRVYAVAHHKRRPGYWSNRKFE
jgi:toxin ParE1/3/4